MSPGATFERVYRALKIELGSGRFLASDPLEPAALADEFNSSITPVRDALHRLVGEGLVEAPRGDGFRVPLITEVGLRHLYAWTQWILLKGVNAATRPCPPLTAVDGGDVSARGEEAIFLAIAAWTGNAEHVAATARLNDRLRGVRRIEARILADAEAEIRELKDLLGSDRGTLRQALGSYHRRRLKAAPLIVAALHGR